MKQIVAWLWGLFLFCGFSASAETLSVPVWMGEDEMQVAMEHYENDMGVSMAYDPAYFFMDSKNQEVVYFAQTPTAFLSFQDLDMSIQEVITGLTLQAKADEYTVNDAVLGGLFSDSIPVVAVIYEEMVEDVSYQHAFYLVARGANTLMVECYYPTTIDMVTGAELTAMLQTITIQGYVAPTAAAYTTASPQISSDMVRCEICGEWFKAGNEFRNHQCISYPEESSDMVQCEICGGWFEAGNEFRNHQCIGYPEESSDMVQCEICGGWFEAGNEFRNHQCIGYPEESSDMVQCEICGGWFKAGNEFRNHQCIGYPEESSDMVQCEICGGWFEAGNEFRNHQCVSYPAADDRIETYPSEDNIIETYPSEDNIMETYPSYENETYPQE